MKLILAFLILFQDKKAIVKLSLDYQILSNFTSYVVTQENPENTTFGEMTFVTELEKVKLFFSLS
jgi:hypothetical protein